MLIPYLERIDRAGILLAALLRSRADFKVIEAASELNRRVVDAINAVAATDRKMLSLRVKAGLDAANGRQAGTRQRATPPNLSKEDQERGRLLAVKARQRKSAIFAAEHRPLIQEMLDEELSHYAIAKLLNDMKISTAGGKIGKWDATKVRRLLERPPLPDDPPAAEFKLEQNWPKDGQWKRLWRNKYRWKLVMSERIDSMTVEETEEEFE